MEDIQQSLETLIQAEYKSDFELLLKGGSYADLLKNEEWQSLRIHILKRDKHTCTLCNNQETFVKYHPSSNIRKYFDVRIPDNCRKYKNYFQTEGILESYNIFDERDIVYKEVEKPIILHVHHQYYIIGRQPWQYQLDCFQTLCVNCHYELHKRQKFPFLIIVDGEFTKWSDMAPCSKCNGAGILPHYNYYKGGICFKCKGERYIKIKNTVL